MLSNKPARYTSWFAPLLFVCNKVRFPRNRDQYSGMCIQKTIIKSFKYLPPGVLCHLIIFDQSKQKLFDTLVVFINVLNAFKRASNSLDPAHAYFVQTVCTGYQHT